MAPAGAKSRWPLPGPNRDGPCQGRIAMAPAGAEEFTLTTSTTSSLTLLSSAFVEITEITMCRTTRRAPVRPVKRFALVNWATWEVGPDTHGEPTQRCAESGAPGGSGVKNQGMSSTPNHPGAPGWTVVSCCDQLVRRRKPRFTSGLRRWTVRSGWNALEYATDYPAFQPRAGESAESSNRTAARLQSDNSICPTGARKAGQVRY